MDQLVEGVLGVVLGSRCQVGVAGGGQDRTVAEKLLDLEQIDAGFNQVGGITMAIMPNSA